MTDPITNRILTLAGIVQAAWLVKQVANTGVCDTAPLEASIGSLFRLDEGEVAAVYGGVEGVADGLRRLHSMLAGQSGKRDGEVTKYLVGALHLERKLRKRRDALTTLGEGIDNARAQAEHFSQLHENVLANLADLYIRAISPIGPRIMVAGDPHRLNETATQNKVRALLLAAIRSAMLWRHHGGSKWQLLFQRRRMLEETKRLLDLLPA